jgi:hypothetical protein
MAYKLHEDTIYFYPNKESVEKANKQNKKLEELLKDFKKVSSDDKFLEYLYTSKTFYHNVDKNTAISVFSVKHGSNFVYRLTRIIYTVSGEESAVNDIVNYINS